MENKTQNEIIVDGKYFKVGRINDEWYVDIIDPIEIIKKLKCDKRADIFTFWERDPFLKKYADYKYRTELESVALLEIKSYQQWFSKQIDSKTRNMIRKAEKKGVKVNSVLLDDNFITGIESILNETPIRQGRYFPHYKKSFENIKNEIKTFEGNSIFLGAFYGNELIGYMKLVCEKDIANIMQILSMVQHRDKAPNNALLAKAIEVCESKKINNLIYARWIEGSLGEFKIHNGFKKVDIPRYYVPISKYGGVIIRLNLHGGIKNRIPKKIVNIYKRILSKLLNARNYLEKYK